jgi:outer membrane protein assembly factor BamB
MTCLRAATGHKVWEGDLGGDAVYYASPTIADGKIYLIDTSGTVVGRLGRHRQPPRDFRRVWGAP